MPNKGSNKKTLLAVILILLAFICLVFWYLLNVNGLKNGTKVYSNNIFSIEYPSSYLYSELSQFGEDGVIFFKNKQDLDDYEKCFLLNQYATPPCDKNLVYNIIYSLKDENYLKSTLSGKPGEKEFTDQKNRRWQLPVHLPMTGSEFALFIKGGLLLDGDKVHELLIEFPIESKEIITDEFAQKTLSSFQLK